MGSSWVPKHTLEGDLTILRPFDLTDVGVLARILADEWAGHHGRPVLG